MVNVCSRHGQTRFGCLFSLLLLTATGYFGYNIGTVYWREYEYQDAMNNEARFAAHNSDDVITLHLQAKSDSLALPEAARRVNIRRKDNQIWIWADYVETVEFPGMVRDIEMQPHVERVF
jgi:hypothetical protein